MFWPTLSIVLIIAAAVGAVLLRHPGVVLYDWIASRRMTARARPAAPVAQPSPRADERPGRPVLAG
ncbi:hypothetical protein ACMZ4X_01145 [Achromobacter marplatensis]